MTDAQALLLERLRHAGIVDVVAVEPATGGLAATAGIARRRDGSCVFIKTFVDPSSEGAFVAEADGRRALNKLGGTAFFDLYAGMTGLDRGWRERMPIIQLRQHLAVIAQFDHDWGTASRGHATLAPFWPRPR